MSQSEEQNAKPLFKGSLIAGFLAVVLTVVLAYGYMQIFAPEAYEPPAQPFSAYDSGTMRQSLSVSNVTAVFRDIKGFGSRFMGQSGNHEIAEYLTEAYAKAGLEIIKLEDRAPVPVTHQRRIVGEDGSALKGVEIFPFFPNTYQPMVTPAEGLRGTLQVVTSATEVVDMDLTGKILIYDLSDNEVTPDWIKPAMRGAEAVVLTHTEGLAAIPWRDVTDVAAGNNPVNFVRLAATPSILNHAGERVRLDVRTAWENVEHTTIVGRLAAKEPASEALVLPVAYDSYSMLPDLALSARTAIGIASHLQLLNALPSYADSLKRDVYFVAFGGAMSASAGERALMPFIGPLAERQELVAIWEAEIQKAQASFDDVRKLDALLQDDLVISDADAMRAMQESLTNRERTLFREQLRFVINTLAFNKKAEVSHWRSLFEQEGGEDTSTEAFKQYLTEKNIYNELQSKAGDPPGLLMDSRTETLAPLWDRFDIGSLIRERFAALVAFHREELERLSAGNAAAEWMRDYRQLVVLDVNLTVSDRNGGESLTFLSGETVGRNDAIFGEILRRAVRRLPPESRPELKLFLGQPNEHNNRIRSSLGDLFADRRGGELWAQFGYAGFSLVHSDRQDEYNGFFYPIDQPGVDGLLSIRRGLVAAGEAALTLAHGNGQFDLPIKRKLTAIDYSGVVYASGVGRSIIPNYPVAGALVGRRHPDDQFLGRVSVPLVMTDLYGAYRMRFTPLAFGPDVNNLYSPIAVKFGDDGIIRYIKDKGAIGQRVYRSEGLNTWARKQGGRDVNLVLYETAPVSILDMVNPQTMNAFAGADALRRKGLQPFDRQHQMMTPKEGILTLFVPPSEKFFLVFKAGSVENENVQTIRAIMLGDGPHYKRNPNVEIDGPGLLAEVNPYIRNLALPAARSLTGLNESRLTLQRQFQMADELTLEFHERSESRLAVLDDGKESEQLGFRDRLLMAREALTYAILNHPVIRGNVTEAVIGIVWYLGLLVPFVLFFEKLLFGFSDIRKQLVANLVIFLIVFGLLRTLHPAFAMIRSSFMILLGFLIFLISSLVTLLLSGKFKENLEALKQAQAKVKGADVNTVGVLVTAFMLGLNNMHRRKVRTGLTCATLVLLTFVMICFTSVQNDVVSTAKATGRAAYQGLLVKQDRYGSLSQAQLDALGTRYAHRFRLSKRAAYFGVKAWSQEVFNPEIVVSPDRRNGSRDRLSERLLSCLLMDASEPLAGQIELLTDRGWFTRSQQRDASGVVPVMLPSEVANRLQISVEDVNAGKAFVTINGTRCEVYGIFDSDSLGKARDLDGQSLLPFDIQALQMIRTGVGGEVLADAGSPVMDPSQVMISLNGRFETRISVAAGNMPTPARPVSMAVEMPAEAYVSTAGVARRGNDYRTVREAIQSYLEQSQETTHYGLERFAYIGRRVREQSIGGLIDMLIPLIIAALTVVNTMRGSVYERRDEIFVYNAVGIAPRYVFFMFFAEAFVYSVVGAVLGYILSQGTGRVLMALDLTGGLNMNFTSLSTVYASLTIAGAVFLSTWFPARSAMEIAAPADDAGWEIPKPEGDEMRFKLPFTFGQYDRVAVLGFFARYLADNGEGSSGPFFAGPPELKISSTPDKEGNGGPVPLVTATIWLKPFDLGVSQQLTIELPTDAETGEFIAELTLKRLSGTLESWERLNKGFVAKIRRHFLHWRAVSTDMKANLYADARAMLTASETDNG